jgi:hypothetical protein
MQSFYLHLREDWYLANLEDRPDRRGPSGPEWVRLVACRSLDGYSSKVMDLTTGQIHI